MAKRKTENSHTTICISWQDKEEFRKFAQFVKKTKTGSLYESDAVLFKKILDSYKKDHNASEQSYSTYPSRTN
jgi:hypothetical protein